jgi:hypothetical protein
VLSAAAVGVALLARSTPLLLAVGGIALFIAALDILEPFAAEIDHPPRSSLTACRPACSLRATWPRRFAVLVAIGLVAAGISIAVAPGAGRDSRVLSRFPRRSPRSAAAR